MEVESVKEDDLGGVSLIIPAYNEELAITQGVTEARAALESTGRLYEIIVVDDGSTDRTGELAAALTGVTLLTQPENRGYGAALKAGIRASKYDYIMITDADGTYPAASIPDLLDRAAQYDMVVGARIGKNVSIPNMRKPAKWFLGKLAGHLAGRPIPDLNSGLRVMKRDQVRRFMHLLPSGFSFTTTITLAMLCTDQLVYYHPIDYFERQGESKIRPKHALEFLILILRIIVYFNPLKIFLPLGTLFFAGGVLKFLQDLTLRNMSETAILGILGGTLVWSVGLLSDQIARSTLRDLDQ